MKYMLLMYADESIVAKYSKEEFQAAAKTWTEFAQEISASGVLISNSGLSPVANATTVRVRNDKTLITDGPFAETHEQLGGKDSQREIRLDRDSTCRYPCATVVPEIMNLMVG
jgi:hypothetical protein